MKRSWMLVLVVVVGSFSPGCADDDHIDEVRICGLRSLGRTSCGSPDRCGAIGIEITATPVVEVNLDPGFVYCRGGRCASRTGLFELPETSYEMWVQGVDEDLDDCFRFLSGRIYAEGRPFPPPPDESNMGTELDGEPVSPHYLLRGAVVERVCWRSRDGYTPPCSDTSGDPVRFASVGAQGAEGHVLSVGVDFTGR